MGLDLTKGVIRNNLEHGVIEPAMSKVKIIQVGWLTYSLVTHIVYAEIHRTSHITFFALQFATEAAITIVRIDDMIKLDKEESGQEE